MPRIEYLHNLPMVDDYQYLPYNLTDERGLSIFYEGIYASTMGVPTSSVVKQTSPISNLPVTSTFSLSSTSATSSPTIEVSSPAFTANAPDKTTINTRVGVGIGLAVLCALLIIATILYFVKRRKHKGITEYATNLAEPDLACYASNTVLDRQSMVDPRELEGSFWDSQAART